MNKKTGRLSACGKLTGIWKGKKYLLLYFLSVALLAAIAGTVYFVMENEELSRVMTINKEPVSKREYKLIMSDQVAGVYSYFSMKYGVQDSKEFWASSYGGESTRQYLETKILEALKRIKVEQAMCKEYGIVEDISYKHFIKEWQSENRRRKEALHKGEVIYGPQQYGEREYFNYVLSNSVERLKEKLGKSDFALGEQDIVRLYERDKADKYKNGDRIVTDLITVSWAGRDGKASEQMKAEARKYAEEIMSRLEKGEGIEAIKKAYPVGRVYGIAYSESVIDDKSRNRELSQELEYKKAMLGIKKDENIGPIEENSMMLYAVIHCKERKTGEFKPLSEVMDSIIAGYIEQQYTSLIEKLASEARLELDQKRIRAINPR